MGDGLQNSTLSFEQLYEQARQSVPMVQDLGEKILADIKTRYPDLFEDAELEIGSLKEWDRVINKVKSDYCGIYAKICDLARGRIIVDTPEQIETLRRYFQDNIEQKD